MSTKTTKGSRSRVKDHEKYRSNPFWETTEFHRRQQEKAEMVERNGTDIPSTSHKFKRHKCKRCGAWFIWMRTKNGKHIAVDVDTFEDGDTLYDRKKHACHWETCTPKSHK